MGADNTFGETHFNPKQMKDEDRELAEQEYQLSDIDRDGVASVNDIQVALQDAFIKGRQSMRSEVVVEKASTITPSLLEKQIADILKNNITFSGQLGDYVIHGAIEKIVELVDDAFKRGYEEATSEAIKEIHKNYEPKG